MLKLTCVAIGVAVLLILTVAIFGAPQTESSRTLHLLADGPEPFPNCLPPIIPCSGSTKGTVRLRNGFSGRETTEVAIIERRQRPRLRRAA